MTVPAYVSSTSRRCFAAIGLTIPPFVPSTALESACSPAPVAKQLLVGCFLNEVVDRLDHAAITSHIHELIEAKFRMGLAPIELQDRLGLVPNARG
jgi:hypothetical protein